MSGDIPSDLYARPEVYKDTVVFGSLMNHTDSKPYVEAAELALFLVSDDLWLTRSPLSIAKPMMI